MKRLTLSLLLVVVSAVIGLGWGIDQWYNHRYAMQEDPAIKAYRQLGAELVQLLSTGSMDETALQRWIKTTSLSTQLSAYSDFPLPENLKTTFEQGEPLLLDSGSEISLYYYLPPHQQVLAINLPADLRAESHSGLRWGLTLLFYTGVILVVLIWLYPLLKRLAILRHTARAFGSGNLSVRIPQGNVSYIREIEQEFNRMAQHIENLIYDNKLLSRGLSHDLRTPLARLRFGLDVLDEAELTPAQQECMEHLNRDLRAMESLVETLLNYARFDEAKVAFQPVAIQLATFVQTLMDEFYRNQIRLHIDIKACEIKIEADPEYLAMLVHNLIQNALLYGKGEVLVQVLNANDQVCLVVEDNGDGIPAAERDNVLKPFYRIKTAHNTGGHGMGLAIVERIAKWHKAEVRLTDSNELNGLKVLVCFPQG